MREGPRRTRRSRWLVALLAAVVLVCGLAPVRAWAADGAVYVSNTGKDEAGDGSQGNPYATLAKAVEAAEDGDTIYVMSDLTMTSPARFWNKHLTIRSQGDSPVTVTRGDTMAVVSDRARANYNSAMLEVNVTGGTASLTLENIVFDDAGKHVGKYYIQADSEGDGETAFGDLSAIPNIEIVQDAMVATYEGAADVTLGEGAVLKNYGGVSAVRLAGGKMTMLSGSKICDDTVTDRTQGEIIPDETLDYSIADLYGPAGAIWMQGGTLVMEKGSEISGIVGRSIFNEGGTATINGSIHGMVADPHASQGDKSDFWHGNNGAAIYLRSGASATLGSTGVIDGEGKNPGATSIAVTADTIDEELVHCTFTTNPGSVIKGIADSTVIDVSGTAYLNGEITGLIGSGHAIVAQSSTNHYVRIGETASISNNECNYGVIYTQGSNGVIDLYGKMNDNVSRDRGGAIVLANNGSHVEVNMYPGAEMCRNVSWQTGGAIMVSCGTFTMHGGTIADNISGAGDVGESDQVGGGVFVRRGGQFIMNGGEITNNSAVGFGGNVAVILEDYNSSISYIELNGGSISGGMMNSEVLEADGEYSASGGTSNDITVLNGGFGKTDRYLRFGSSLELANQNVYMQKYDLTLKGLPYDVKVGNPSTEAESTIATELGAYELTKVVGSFWFESNRSVQSFTVGGLNYDQNKPLFAAMVKTGADGLPLVDADVKLQAVVPDGNDDVRVVLDEYSETGYAVSFVQQNDDADGIVSVIPADMTVYMGGDEGYEGVGDSGSTSLPHPMFQVVAPSSVDVTKLTFRNEGSGNAWKLVPVEMLDQASGVTFYRFDPVAPTTTPVRVEFNDGTGAVDEDAFDIIQVGDLYKEFSIGIYAGETSGKVQATEPVDTGTGASTEKIYNVVAGSGLLTVRAVSDSTNDSVVSPVRASAPKADDTAAAVAVATSSTTYTLNDTGVKLPSDAAPSLLFDEIITSDGVARDEALVSAVDEELGAVDDSHIRLYDLRYLDLIDANNGNAWITSSEGVDIYWAYPEGTDESTSFSLLHFKGLHRDGNLSGFDVSDVASIDPETIEIGDANKTEYGIYFHVDKGGFSPFALVWEADARTITASAGANGTISPSGTIKVPLGSDQTFTITPNQGYEIADVRVDGKSVGAVGTYTFTDVQEGHTIEATFKSTSGGGGPVTPSETYNITSSAGEGGSISPSGTHEYAAGSDVSFSISPDEGYTVGSVTVDGVNVGQRTSYTFADLDADHTISVTFMPGSAPADPDDTGVSDWLQAGDHIAFLHGYGDGSGTFGPENDMTRAEVAQMFYNLLLDKSRGDVPVAFEDIPEGAYYEEAVLTLASRGIVNGTSPETYEPNRPITRAEFVAIAMRFSNGEFEGENTFVDVPEDAWYRDYVVGATGFGWIVGYQDGSRRFGPEDTITRGQATMVTNRMLGRVADGAWIVAHLDDVKTFVDLGQDHYAFFDVVEATNAHDYERDGHYESWTGLVK
ncbi:MAG TPA: S-layer homology domain-containing protein [Candidatus Olsenella avicola]|nr:S-layer homology domain-containing protein [Candidatus Olsenella avicola]